MKKHFFIFILIFVQILVFGQKNFLDQPYIETSAKADTLVTPDKIYLSIKINEADSKNKKSVEQQENEMEKTLKKLGVNTEKDLTLLDLTSNFKNYFLKGQNVLKSKQYELLLKDAVTAGKVIIELENIGISNVNIDRTEYSKTKELVLDLKAKAVTKSKTTAEKMVKPLGQRIGKALHISENHYSNDYYERSISEVVIKKSATSSNYSPEPVNIEIKKIKLQAEVFVKYALD